MSLWDWLWRRRQREEDLDEEIQAHLRMAAHERVEQGQSTEQAHASAVREFGNVVLVKEVTRDMWGLRWLEVLLQDLCYGARQLHKNPGFTAVAVMTLALGIGANAAIFGLIDAMLLRPLPVSNPSELVELWTVVPNYEHSLFSFPMASEIESDSRLFSSVALWSCPPVPLEVNGESELGALGLVTPDYFRTLGVRPLLGRLFGPEDFTAGGGTPEDLAVIGYGFWQARFGRSPAVLGKTLKINGYPHTIIGVTPEGFFGVMVGVATDVWTPLTLPRTSEEELQSRQNQGYWLIARLRPGVSVAMARAELETLWPRVLQSTIPGQANAERRDQFLRQGIRIESAAAGFPATSLLQFERPIWVLMGSAGLLLLIACINLASLLVARAANRRHEMGIRVALGATRWRLARQVMTEGTLLSMGGAILGLPLAYGTSGVLVRLVWTGLVPVALDLRPDRRILLFTGVVACLTGALFSLLPAWQSRRQDSAALMRQPAGLSSKGSGAWRAGKVLIGAQVGLSLVLLVGANLFTRNLVGLRSLDLGFNPDKVLGLWSQAKPGGPKNFDGAKYYRTLIDELTRLPGVQSVGVSKSGPISRTTVKWRAPVSRGSGENPTDSRVDADEHSVSPNFFVTMGIRLLQGRDFSFHDDQHAPAAVIVSRSLAQRFFPPGDAVGQSITVTSETGEQSLQIVGVVNDANLFYVRNHRPLAFYFPFFQQSNPISGYIEIKTYGNPSTVLDMARRRVEASGREDVLYSESLTQAVNNSLVDDRVLALLSDVFGGLALLLVAIGLYGLVSYSVAGRTAEIGVRRALGAEPSGILSLILSDSLRLIAAGGAVGLPVALGMSRLVSKMLFDLSPTDPVSLAAALVIVVGIALLAAYLPARRATKVDPMVALRYE
ncbi:MAG: ABC transporter permease [Terriglobia bacterium]|jgi:predicted permease